MRKTPSEEIIRAQRRYADFNLVRKFGRIYLGLGPANYSFFHFDLLKETSKRTGGVFSEA